MRAAKSMVLAIVVKSYEATDHWVTVPDDLVSKAKALCRDGMLVNGEARNQFRPTKLGQISAGDLDA